MKLFHPSNVYEESWLLFAVTKLLGLYPIKIFKTTFVNYIYPVVLITLYCIYYAEMHNYVLFMFRLFGNINKTYIAKHLRYYMNTVSFLVMTILSAHASLKIRKAFEQIDTVDKNLRYLNIEINYLLRMKHEIFQITGVILIVILFDLMDYYGHLDNDANYMYVLLWISGRLPEFVNTMIICSFAVLVDKIQFRFKELNMVLNSITKGKSFISISESSDVNNAFRLKLLKLLRFELNKTVSLVNGAYAFRFKLLTIVYVTYVCLHINIIYSSTTSQLYAVDVILSTLWGMFDLIRLTYTIHLHRVPTTEYT